MDSLDQELIALLRADARASIATLAHKLDVSRGTITNRIARLEDEGVIVGYTVRLRPDVQTEQIQSVMRKGYRQGERVLREAMVAVAIPE